MIGTVHGLQGLLEVGATGRLSDGQLLDRFVARRDEAVFGAIVDRHGPMVWGVCRRILRDHHDAEDAFQATFLVLARRAGAVAPADRLGAWLHGVALQTALKARSNRARRQSREASGRDAPEPSETPREPGDDLAESLDRVLAGLPEKYRTPIVLCDLEGRSYAEAAEHLGWPIDTVSGRLCRARAMLAKRLARRGVALSAAALVSLGREAASATLPASRLAPLLKAARLTGRASWSGLVSAEAAALCHQVQGGMIMTKFKVTAAALLTAGMLATGIGVLAQGQDEGPGANPSNPQPQSDAKPGGASVARTHYVGDMLIPLPNRPLIDGRPQVDFSPVLDFIKTTIAPGTWQPGGRAERSITLSYENLSLVVRHTPEVQDQIQALLNGHRRIEEYWAHGTGRGSSQPVERTFLVGDLIKPIRPPAADAGAADMEPLCELIRSTLGSGNWTTTEGTHPSLVATRDGRLTVIHNKQVIDQVEALLQRLRRFDQSRGYAPQQEVDVIEVPTVLPQDR